MCLLAETKVSEHWINLAPKNIFIGFCNYASNLHKKHPKSCQFQNWQLFKRGAIWVYSPVGSWQVTCYFDVTVIASNMSANSATYATIGAWIKQRRAALGLTQLQLASKSNCSLSVIRRLERNDYAPSQEIIDCLAKALEIARDDLECFSKLAQEGNSHDIPTVPE